MTRDELLAELTRSLTATHPDRAEDLIRAVEQRLYDDALLHAMDEIATQAINMRSVFVPGGPMDEAVRTYARLRAAWVLEPLGDAPRVFTANLTVRELLHNIGRRLASI